MKLELRRQAKSPSQRIQPQKVVSRPPKCTKCKIRTFGSIRETIWARRWFGMPRSKLTRQIKGQTAPAYGEGAAPDSRPLRGALTPQRIPC